MPHALSKIDSASNYILLNPFLPPVCPSQLGIHPLKGTAGMDERSRDFLSYTEYVFSAERLARNCGRLRIGAIGKKFSKRLCRIATYAMY